MFFGVQRLPFRVKLAGLSLLGLSTAAALPSLMASLAPQQVDPITTASVSDPASPAKASGSEADAMADAAPLEPMPEPVSGAAADTQIAPVRHVLPEAAPVLSSPVVLQDTAEPIVPERYTYEPAADFAPVLASDPVADPVMDEAMLASAPIMGSTQASVAGGAIVLALDHARVMRVTGDIGTIIIGNPAIADAAMPDPRTIVLTGKSYGETNMVMLNPEGDIIAEQMLQVTVRGQNMVSVFRGSQRTTFSCSPTCEISPTPGDTREALEAGLSAFDARNTAALNAATGP